MFIQRVHNSAAMSEYKERLDAAKGGPKIDEALKAPAHDLVGPEKPVQKEGPRHLSAQTEAGLQAMASQLPQQPPPDPSPAEPKDSNEETQPRFSIEELLTANDPLRSPERRKEIESRLTDMDIGDLFAKGEIRQRVPIVPGSFEVTFRTPHTGEDLHIKRMLSKEEGSDQYFSDRYGVLTLAASLVAVNGKLLPTHIGEKRKFLEDEFANRVRIIEGMPVQLVADLVLNCQWFDDRVRSLFQGDALKNG